MKDLLIEQTTQSPKIDFKNTGEFLISGVSNLSYAQKFYSEALDWLREFKLEKPTQLNCVFEIYYSNTSSSLMLVEMLRLINTFKTEGATISMLWRYEDEDEDIQNFGEDLAASTGSEFKYEPI